MFYFSIKLISQLKLVPHPRFELGRYKACGLNALTGPIRLMGHIKFSLIQRYHILSFLGRSPGWESNPLRTVSLQPKVEPEHYYSVSTRIELTTILMAHVGISSSTAYTSIALLTKVNQNTLLIFLNT